MTSPFDGYFDTPAAKSLRGQSAAVRFERRVVEFLMRRLGLGREVAELVREYQEQFGEPRLPFAKFHDRHRAFPVWLLARRVRNAFEMPVEDLANPKRVMRLPVVRVFLNSDDRLPADVVADNHPRGIVFEWLNSNAPRGLWVIHDDSTRHAAALSVNHAAVGRAGRPLRVGIQPFATFIDRLGFSP